MSEIVELKEDVSQSPLYSEDLAPVPIKGRTWNMWSLAAIWVGMAVCIPTYILASYMIKSGLDWVEALVIIFLANLIVTTPMVLNGHAGTKYGVPFPVLGRASFGPMGVHIPSIVRALVACGWFGIQTWIGGTAIHAIGCAVAGMEVDPGLTVGKFVGFGIFWAMNIYFIFKGTESIRWLETFAAPILIGIGIALIVWGAGKGGGFGSVLAQSGQLEKATAQISKEGDLVLSPLTDVEGKVKASQWRVAFADAPIDDLPWRDLDPSQMTFNIPALGGAADQSINVQFKNGEDTSSVVAAAPYQEPSSRWLLWLTWLTGMVGFWATMAISIADITRYARSQKEQVLGQFLGLPGTMLLYSFVGVFVTCAALVGFDDLLISNDAPWDPVALLARFESPVVVIVAQFFMIIATLSTNIAANVIAPANAFANAMPKVLSFKLGGLVTGIIGIIIMPWWLLPKISALLLAVSGFLGPVLGVILADYFFVRKTELSLPDLFKTDGIYRFSNGINWRALFAMAVGIILAFVGYVYPPLNFLYTLAWFIGCFVSMFVYVIAMRGQT